MISKNTFCVFFLVSLWAFTNILFFEPFKREYCSISTVIYCLHDFIRPPKLRLEYKIHHFLCLILAYYGLTDKQIPWPFISILFQTEITNIFLALLEYKIKHVIVKSCFVLSFIYYRIYKLGFLLFITVPNYKGYKGPFIGYLTVISLYILNIYWMFKIFRLLKKSIK